jgi:hypothetical protein
MRLGWVALLLVGCGGNGVSSFAGTVQECHLMVAEAVSNQVDVLFVVDDSSSMVLLQQRLHDEVARILDEQLAHERTAASTWYHFGVISADPADGAELFGGCGIADERRFVEYQRGQLDNLENGTDVGAALGCLAQRGAAGSDEQQPLTMAAQLLDEDIVENRTFRRHDAILDVIFLLGGNYAENGNALLSSGPPDPYDFILGSVAPPSASLDAVVASVPTHVQLPASATDWSALLSWDQPVDSDDFPPCLPDAPTDPAHLDFVVEDVRYDGIVVDEIPACAKTDWTPTCWDLRPACICPSGYLFEVQRPLSGWPRNTETRVSYDCAVP